MAKSDNSNEIAEMIIDTSFNVYSDAKGEDPDSTSPTLRLYHKFLWSKPLPNGKTFEFIKSRNKKIEASSNK